MPDQINLGDLSGNKKFALSVESDTLEDGILPNEAWEWIQKQAKKQWIDSI